MSSTSWPPRATDRTAPGPAWSAAVPARIVLAPDQHVLPLGADALRFGIRPATALALEGVSPTLAQLVLDLAQPASTVEWTARAMEAGVPLDVAEHVLTGLLARGRLVDATVADRCARRLAEATVTVHGLGALAEAVAADLRAAGVGSVRHGADPPSRHEDGAAEPDVVVLAGAPVVGRSQARRLLAEEVDHLLVAVHDGLGMVGPLTLPGRTACLSCLDLTRTDADPDWPAVAARLCSSPVSLAPPTAPLIAATAALAAEQVVQALRGIPAPGPVPAGCPRLETCLAQSSAAPGGRPAVPERCPAEEPAQAPECRLAEAPEAGPPAVGAILQVDLRRASVRRIDQPPHPGCPCGAAR